MMCAWQHEYPSVHLPTINPYPNCVLLLLVSRSSSMAWAGPEDVLQLDSFEATGCLDDEAAAGVDEQLSPSDVLGRIEAVVAQLVCHPFGRKL